jgi:predicted ester cyclase
MQIRSSVLRTALLVSVLSCAAAQRASYALDQASPSNQEVARNKAQARRVYEEGLSQGKFEVSYTDGFVGHSGAVTFRHEDGLAEAKGWRSAFPDLQVGVNLIVGEADLVSVSWTARGTNTGSGNGIQATGKRVEISGLTIFRFVDGAIAEEWTAGDRMGLMRQLGLMPPAPARVPRPQ